MSTIFLTKKHQFCYIRYHSNEIISFREDFVCSLSYINITIFIILVFLDFLLLEVNCLLQKYTNFITVFSKTIWNNSKLNYGSIFFWQNHIFFVSLKKFLSPKHCVPSDAKKHSFTVFHRNVYQNDLHYFHNKSCIFISYTQYYQEYHSKKFIQQLIIYFNTLSLFQFLYVFNCF